MQKRLLNHKLPAPAITRRRKELLIQVKPLADVTDFEEEFSSELEKIWTQLRLGVIDSRR